VSESLNVVGKASRARCRHQRSRCECGFIVGSGYILRDKYGEIIEQGRGSAGWMDSGAKLVRLSVAKLCVKDQGRLAHRMLSRDDDAELEGTTPPFFSVSIELASDVWALTVQAHARGSSCVVAAVDGVLQQAAQAA
jgi:hypothetical protein